MVFIRDIKRIKPFLHRLQDLWELYPDYRFGQLIYLIADEIGGDIFFPEEDVWIGHIESLIDTRSKRPKPKYVNKNEAYKMIEQMVKLNDQQRKYKLNGEDNNYEQG